VEASFGITLAAEAGVILSKASAEATLDVKITFARTGDDNSLRVEDQGGFMLVATDPVQDAAGVGVSIETGLRPAHGGARPFRWEQTGSSTSLSAARNGAKRASTALNGLASLQASGEVAGQRLVERPFTPERSLVRSQYRPPIALDLGKRETVVGSARTVSVRCAVSWVNVIVRVLR
jgi:hypothetical protein